MPEALRSTLVEQPLPKEEQKADRHGNLHHNVPESRRGSDDDGNLTYLPISRHNGYHAWAQNMLPTEVARFIAIQSLTHPNPDKRLGAGQLHEVLDKTRGQELYWPKAFVAGNHPDLPTRMTQDMYHATRVMQMERRAVSNAIAFIDGEGGVPLPEGSHAMQSEAMRFFGVRTGAEVIEGVLSEKHDKQLAYCKSLKYPVRNRILDIVTSAEASRSPHGGEYLWALHEHRSILDLRLRTIEETALRLNEQIQQLVALRELALFGGDAA